jgi:hypothetical protein
MTPEPLAESHPSVRLSGLPPLSGTALKEDARAVAHEVALLDLLDRREDACALLAAWPNAKDYLRRSEGLRVVDVADVQHAPGDYLDVPLPLARMLGRLASLTPRLQFELQQASRELHRRVTAWNAQRLWADNRVRELVVHDERHTRRVDALAAQLAAPLLAQRTAGLTADEAQLLSAAAWLHDWGHEGGEVAPELLGTTSHLVAEQAEEVRTLHGIVTRELLADEWRARHGMEPPLASAVGILCAHHQGWTSFDARRPEKHVRHDGRHVRVRPPSLFEDVDRHNARFTQGTGRWNRLERDRFRRLVALLRVADGSDLGVHRVPDAGAPKHAYLARAIQVRCRAASAAIRSAELGEGLFLEAIGAVRAVSVLAREVATADLRVPDQTDGSPDLADRMLRQLAPLADVAALRELAEYVTFAAETTGFYAQHAAVADVRFDLRAAAPHAPYRYLVTIVVTATPGRAKLAVQSVRHDVHKELEGKDGQYAVRDCLLDAGLRFVEVRDMAATPGTGEALS